MLAAGHMVGQLVSSSLPLSQAAKGPSLTACVCSRRAPCFDTQRLDTHSIQPSSRASEAASGLPRRACGAVTQRGRRRRHQPPLVLEPNWRLPNRSYHRKTSMAARNKLLVLNAGSSSLKFRLFQLLGPAAAGTSGTSIATSSTSAAGGTSGSGGSSPDAKQPAASTGAAAAGLRSVASGLCERIGDPAGGAVMKASRHPLSAGGHLQPAPLSRRGSAATPCLQH